MKIDMNISWERYRKNAPIACWILLVRLGVVSALHLFGYSFNEWKTPYFNPIGVLIAVAFILLFFERDA